jgi:hypothetical protein
MAPHKNPPKEGTPAYKVHKKLEVVDSVGRVIYRFAKKWIVGIISLITVLSIWLGVDIFGKMGIKNPSTQPVNISTPMIVMDTVPERTFSATHISDEYLDDIEEDGYHLDQSSEYYDSNSQYIDSSMFYMEDPLYEEKYIVELLYEIDQYGDTIFIDIYNDGTDSIYYKDY